MVGDEFRHLRKLQDSTGDSDSCTRDFQLLCTQEMQEEMKISVCTVSVQEIEDVAIFLRKCLIVVSQFCTVCTRCEPLGFRFEWERLLTWCLCCTTFTTIVLGNQECFGFASTGFTGGQCVAGQSCKGLVTEWRLRLLIAHEQDVVGWQTCTQVLFSGVLG